MHEAPNLGRTDFHIDMPCPYGASISICPLWICEQWTKTYRYAPKWRMSISICKGSLFANSKGHIDMLAPWEQGISICKSILPRFGPPAYRYGYGVGLCCNIRICHLSDIYSRNFGLRYKRTLINSQNLTTLTLPSLHNLTLADTSSFYLPSLHFLSSL